MTQEITIHPLDVRRAERADYAAYNDYNNLIRAERLPDDPPRPLDRAIADWQTLPPSIEAWVWLARAQQGDIVGSSRLLLERGTDNQHVAQFSVDVLPAWRQQQVGRRLLEPVARTASLEQRRLLISTTYGSVAAGTAFLTRLGGRPGLASHINQLDLATVDDALLAGWLAAPSPEFTLGLWDGPYPDEDLPAIAGLYEVMNQQPFDDLDVEDFQVTPERLRGMEQHVLAGGRKRWTLYARHQASGDFAGFTEILLDPSRPDVLDQLSTAVYPAYRGHGLGRRLKAAMIQKVREEWPAARLIRTGNADSNAAMLRINQALGFRPYLSETMWQVETALVLDYLGLADRRVL